MVLGDRRSHDAEADFRGVASAAFASPTFDTRLLGVRMEGGIVPVGRVIVVLWPVPEEDAIWSQIDDRRKDHKKRRHEECQQALPSKLFQLSWHLLEPFGFQKGREILISEQSHGSRRCPTNHAHAGRRFANAADVGWSCDFWQFTAEFARRRFSITAIAPNSEQRVAIRFRSAFATHCREFLLWYFSDDRVESEDLAYCSEPGPNAPHHCAATGIEGKSFPSIFVSACVSAMLREVELDFFLHLMATAAPAISACFLSRWLNTQG